MLLLFNSRILKKNMTLQSPIYRIRRFSGLHRINRFSKILSKDVFFLASYFAAVVCVVIDDGVSLDLISGTCVVKPDYHRRPAAGWEFPIV